MRIGVCETSGRAIVPGLLYEFVDHFYTRPSCAEWERKDKPETSVVAMKPAKLPIVDNKKGQ